MGLFLALAWSCASAGAENAPAAPPPELTVDFISPGVISVLVDGSEWFRSDAVSFTENGNKFSVAAGTLKHVDDGKSISGSDVSWGAYSGLQSTFRSTAGDVMLATVKLYAEAGAVTFSQTYPDGLTNATVAKANTVASPRANRPSSQPQPPFGANTVSSAFPSFRPKAIPRVGFDGQRRWMGYNGWDCGGGWGCVSSQGNRVALGIWDNETAVLPEGLEGGSCVAQFNPGNSLSYAEMAKFKWFILNPFPD